MGGDPACSAALPMLVTTKQVQLRRGIPLAEHLTPLPFFRPRMAPPPGNGHMSVMVRRGRMEPTLKVASAHVRLRYPGGMGVW